MMKGNVNNSQEALPTMNHGRDRGESSGVNMIGREKITVKHNVARNGEVGGAIRADQGRRKVTGSRFARLETIEEMDGHEMESEGLK